MTASIVVRMRIIDHRYRNSLGTMRLHADSIPRTVLNLPGIMSLSALALGVAAVVMSTGPALAHSKGLYATEAEAQQRAAELGCNAVHQNNGRWMPCANERELHQQLRKQ